MKKSQSMILVSVGAVLLAGCGGRTVGGTDDAPKSLAASPDLTPSAASDAGATAAPSATSSGTSENPSSAPPTTHVATTDCAGVGSSCRLDADCCGSSWCNNFTYAPSTCVSPLPDGLSCETNAQCQSGICQDYVCVAHACARAGTACNGDADCCRGSFCDNQGYGPTECTSALPAGRYCLADKWCQSGRCVGYQCN